MSFSKLFSSVNSCTGHELKRFALFLESPYFNQDERLSMILDLLREHHPHCDSSGISPKMLWESHSPGKKLNAGQMRQLATRLTSQLELFWAVQNLKKDEFEREFPALQTYFHRNLHKPWRQQLRKVRKALEGIPNRDSDWHARAFRLERLAHGFNIQNDNRADDPHIQPLLHSLDEWYLLNKLKFACAAINRKNILQTELDLGLLRAIEGVLNQEVLGERPLVEAYWQVLGFLRNPDHESGFLRLLDLMNLHKSKFPAQEKSDLAGFALNYVIQQLNRGRPGYLERLFDLYRQFAEEGLLLVEGQLPAQHFKNIITVGLRLYRIEETEAFLETMGPQVNKTYRGNAIRYSKAAIHFARKDYGSSLRLLQEVEFSDVFYHLDAKSLLLKTWYELFDPDPFFSLVDTFRVYLRRNQKVSDYQRKIYQNQVKYANWLMRGRLGDRRVLKKVELVLEGNPEAADSRWLKEKLEKLRERKS